jgi:hypothetical protein
MSRPHSILLTATALVTCAVLVPASAAGVHQAPLSGGRQDPGAALTGRQNAAPSAHLVRPDPSDAVLEGLDSRVKEATDQATRDGANISVFLLDRTTKRTVSNGNDAPIATASVAKLFIADDLLYQASINQTPLPTEDRAALDAMLQVSDDDAAERFWDRGGGDAIVVRVADRYGLLSTGPGSDGRWWNTITTATDLVHYYDELLDGTGGLPSDQAAIIIGNLSLVPPEGLDGYPQRFGIPDGLFAERVAVKQGWMCCIGADWFHLSTGVIGVDRRYVLVIESLQATDDRTARDEITEVVKTMFPTGQI